MSILIVELIQYFFMQLVLNKVFQIMKVLSTSKFFAHREFVSSHDSKLSKSHVSFTKNTTLDDDVTLTKDDVEVLMAHIGLFYHPESEKLPEMLNSTDLLNIFEQEQPKLDEVRGAFEVFDENKDGYIDSSELQRVLCALGFKERAGIEDCKKMIGAFDLNADGRLDFIEFVKFMENTYC
ncbi:probable calcium-binding protein CML46 [Rutidosis leptorrhynchoides]|uniref:probable calcium-binding protein CML46 n=1 Tax=Rutidosis leptorrhynchoides TaxID=125765 RepID=UPI003A99C1DE